MALFVVSYDLIKRKDYPKLWEALGDLGAFRVLRSVWLVDYNTEADGLRSFLRQYIDEDDALLVIEFHKKPAAWKCRQGTKTWLEARF